MSERYDVLIVGAGLFGATCAHELRRRRLRCLVLEKRSHVGGNCYTQERDGIHVHLYGPHIFHTSNQRIWNFVRQFAEFNGYRHRVRVNYRGTLYSFPLNLETFSQMWGVTTPEQARAELERARDRRHAVDNLEGWALGCFGRQLYETFIEGYTRKQWGRSPSELPASILKRLPVRLTADDSYFDDCYQGIPDGGYTRLVERLLDGTVFRLNADYFDDRRHFDGLARRIVYTGPLDRFFDYRFGRLEYRSLFHEHERLDVANFQDVAIVNYTEERVPFTRIIEHKHFVPGDERPITWITREYPAPSSAELEPMYPVRDARNSKVLERYQTLAREPEYSLYGFGGRLAEYVYYDMHQVIAAALKMAERVAQALTGP